ncbi:MAG: pentapeptide repeat-containing protein [Alphaproteobacteria bacterium]
MLAAHKKWLETKGKHGNQAHLPGANLQRANLQKAHLEEANLQKADLRADLQGANLTEVKGLSEATLQNANLDSYQEPFIDTILVV